MSESKAPSVEFVQRFRDFFNGKERRNTREANGGEIVDRSMIAVCCVRHGALVIDTVYGTIRVAGYSENGVNLTAMMRAGYR